MENERDLIERLERIEAKENQRLLLGKIQLALVAVLVVGLAVVLCIVLPKANDLYMQTTAAVTQAQNIMAETEGVLTEIDWEKFKEIDFSKFNEVDFSKFNDLDIEGLNTAINNLNEAVKAVQEKAAETQKVFESISQWFGQLFGN